MVRCLANGPGNLYIYIYIYIYIRLFGVMVGISERTRDKRK